MRVRAQQLVFGLLFTSAMTFQANAAVKANNLVVEFPADLPVAAQQASIDMFLNEAGNGSTLLYLEQDNGKTLSILDVTEPSEIKLVGKVSSNAAAPFQVVSSLGDGRNIIRYENGEVAMLDLKNPKKPVVAPLPKEMAEASAPEAATEYKIVDLNGSKGPKLLATVNEVTHRLERPETATTFLLNAKGLTVVRHPDEETSYRAANSVLVGN